MSQMPCPKPHSHVPLRGFSIAQSALFNFQSLLLVILLLICTCTYMRAVAPRLIDRNKEGYVAPLPVSPIHHPFSPPCPVLSCWMEPRGGFQGLRYHPSIHPANVPPSFAMLRCHLLLAPVGECGYADANTPPAFRFLGLFWMSARIGTSSAKSFCTLDKFKPDRVITAGERLSPYVALACVAMAVTLLVQ